ncbi:ComF family protein [Patescibacteria group bacterium]|nr:ComF family protein [Patescibacteria group bacterium]MCL5010232.1 ComF family protein [Patescibacteria group bacterium]
MGLFDFIFPKYCVSCKKIGSYLCENCFSYLSFDTGSFCPVCRRPSFNNLTHPVCKNRYAIDGAFSGIVYNKTAKRLIHRFKYGPYVSDLRGILVDFLFESIIQNETFNRILELDSSAILIPIPLHASRFRKRGYNQAEILAQELGAKLGLSKIDALERAKNTHSQAGLREKERIKNMKGAFRLKKYAAKIVHGKTAFLVDDILTTGSTLTEAANVLKRGGAKTVFGLTLARD